MDFYDVIERRRSVRAFQDKDVDQEVLDRMLKAVRSCPTAGNLQAFKVHAFRSAVRKQAISEAAYGQGFIADAPVVLVFSATPSASSNKYGKRGKELYSIQDATIATAFAHLAAAAEGLGSCWIGAFDPKAVIEAAGLPPDHMPVALLPIGHPTKETGRTSRRQIKDIVTFDDM